MIQIGLISDTHGQLDEKYRNFIGECDEIWHAGDIGNASFFDSLGDPSRIRAVYGNIDGQDLRSFLPEIQEFVVEKVRVLMIHIGGYPGRYDQRIRERLKLNPPDIFISGHSHILKVIKDSRLDLLHINPGACGKQGFHGLRTAVRFKIEGEKIFDLEILEMKR